LLAATSELGEDLAQFRDKLLACSRSCDDLAGNIVACTAVTEEKGRRKKGAVNKKKRGRHTINYVSETRDLMRVYQEVTGKRVVSPKGVDKDTDEAEQYSTAFIARNLKLIDPDLGTWTAITCIRNAQKLEVDVDKLFARYAKEMAAKG
jgi:hypothetical protein